MTWFLAKLCHFYIVFEIISGLVTSPCDCIAETVVQFECSTVCPQLRIGMQNSEIGLHVMPSLADQSQGVKPVLFCKQSCHCPNRT